MIGAVRQRRRDHGSRRLNQDVDEALGGLAVLQKEIDKPTFPFYVLNNSTAQTIKYAIYGRTPDGIIALALDDGVVPIAPRFQALESVGANGRFGAMVAGPTRVLVDEAITSIPATQDQAAWISDAQAGRVVTAAPGNEDFEIGKFNETIIGSDGTVGFDLRF